MHTNPLLVLVWLAAIRNVVRGISLGTVLREVEDYPRAYRPHARA